MGIQKHFAEEEQGDETEESELLKARTQKSVFEKLTQQKKKQ